MLDLLSSRLRYERARDAHGSNLRYGSRKKHGGNPSMVCQQLSSRPLSQHSLGSTPSRRNTSACACFVVSSSSWFYYCFQMANGKGGKSFGGLRAGACHYGRSGVLGSSMRGNPASDHDQECQTCNGRAQSLPPYAAHERARSLSGRSEWISWRRFLEGSIAMALNPL